MGASVDSTDLPGQVAYRLIRTADTKEEIYNLRYRAYLREGAVNESADRRITDHYDDLPNSWIFGVYCRGELYGSIRINILTDKWRSSCAADAYREIVDPWLDRGLTVVDSARFVGDPEKRSRFQKFPYVTLRLVVLACEHFSADIALALVRVEHQPFYRRVFSHSAVTEPRMFPEQLKPFGLMITECAAVREGIFDRYPIMRSTTVERRQLFQCAPRVAGS